VRTGATQVWMAEPFCAAVWFDGEQCAEHKGDELRIGAGWKLDLPLPAWLLLVGRRPDGTWLLSAVAKDNDQPPAPWAVPVDGAMLVRVVLAEPATPPGSSSPTATGTGSAVTPTPAPPTLTATPTATRRATGTPQILYGNMCRPDPTPEYPHSQMIVGQSGLTGPTYFWYCIPKVTPDLIILVPMATYQASYDNGPRKLLEDLGVH